MIISEGVATDGEIMTIGNTQTHVKFSLEPDAYMDDWFANAPTHHFALSVGKNAQLFVKIAKLLKIEYKLVG
jgi:L-arabinose isomerase